MTANQSTKRIAFDLLTDFNEANEWPIDGTDPHDSDVKEAFLGVLMPAFKVAAEALGFEAVFTRGMEFEDIRRSDWSNDFEAYNTAWQSVHDNADFDIVDAQRAARRAGTRS